MNFITETLITLIGVWREGRTGKRVLIVVAGVFGLLSAVAFVFTQMLLYDARLVRLAAYGCAGVAVLCYWLIVGLRTVEDRTRVDHSIQEKERRYEQHPELPQAAWDLARTKLESYLDRNLSQVRSIFGFTVFVMLVGFAFVTWGVVIVYRQPERLTAAVVASVCGILVNLIGATFLVVYRATMAQAKEYVEMLERINAVGMSVQVLEAMRTDNAALYGQTVSQLALKLLGIYEKGSIRSKK